MNLKKILGTVAPFLGTMIGGPFGAAAGKLVGQVLLGNENASEAEIEKALAQATPEQLVELRRVDAEYQPCNSRLCRLHPRQRLTEGDIPEASNG